jgi:hypothetical protein
VIAIDRQWTAALVSVARTAVRRYHTMNTERKGRDGMHKPRVAVAELAGVDVGVLLGAALVLLGLVWIVASVLELFK